jgi:SPP1 gp7 family putative phage head morphogenesis protein
MIAHHLQIQRLASHEYQKMLEILKELSRELAKQTILIDPTAPMRVRYRNERTKNLMDEGRRIIGEKFTEMLKDFRGDMYELAKIEADFAVSSLAEVTGISIGTTLTAEQMRAVVNASYIEGGLLKDWFSRVSEGYRLAFQKEVTLGMVAGEGIDKIVRRIIGGKREFQRESWGESSLYDKQKRGMEALVRTSVMKVSNEARNEAFKKNESLIKGYQWLATLDDRTCMVCAVLDGKSWDLEGHPIGPHEFEYSTPPLHWSCRCVLTCILKSMRELGFDMDEMPESVRASMDGQVPESWTFEEWVSRKGEAEQTKILSKTIGKGRYKLWKAGKITFNDLITQKGRPMTLEELRRTRHVFVGNYPPGYEAKLWSLDKKLMDNGINSSEHALNKLQGRFQSSRKGFAISSVEPVIDAYKNGERYIDPGQGTVRMKNNVAIHLSDDGVVKSYVYRKDAKDTWEKL